MESLYQKFKESAHTHSSRSAVVFKVEGRWESYDYAQFLTMVDRLADGLAALGVKQGDRLAILSENRPEWLASDLAINKLGAVSVPIHATADRGTIEYILNDSGSGFLFVSPNLFTMHRDFLLSKMATLKIIMFDGGDVENHEQVLLYRDILTPSPTSHATLQNQEPSVFARRHDEAIQSFTHLRNIDSGLPPARTHPRQNDFVGLAFGTGGRRSAAAPLLVTSSQVAKTERLTGNGITKTEFKHEPVFNELASIVYTSGTTGDPKGAMLSNGNFLSNIYAVFEKFDIRPSDIFLSFLPVSHVLERTLGSYIPILSGASIAYAENIKQLSSNLQEIKPTIIVGVPRIFEKTKEKIFANIRNKNFVIKRLFFLSLKKDDGSLLKKLADRVMYKKIRAAFGGRLRFAVSGGAAIHERILRFYTTVGINLIEGYGLTETSPIVTCNTLEDRTIGSVGKPLSCVEVKIAEDKEILTRGACVMLGYWNKPDATKEAIDKDGWFKTGDLGFVDTNGILTIIGRKKDIIVTSNGKNISPEKLENTINLSPYISQSLVVGHKRKHVCALVVPDNVAIKENFKEGETDVKKLIKKEIEKANERLSVYEKINNFKMLEQPFTIETGELTPTLKLRRRVVEEKYKEMIEELYKDA